LAYYSYKFGSFTRGLKKQNKETYRFAFRFTSVYKRTGKNLTIENKTQIENVLVKSALFS
jgi:hypothetical protein